MAPHASLPTVTGSVLAFVLLASSLPVSTAQAPALSATTCIQPALFEAEAAAGTIHLVVAGQPLTLTVTQANLLPKPVLVVEESGVVGTRTDEAAAPVWHYRGTVDGGEGRVFGLTYSAGGLDGQILLSGITYDLTLAPTQAANGVLCSVTQALPPILLPDLSGPGPLGPGSGSTFYFLLMVDSAWYNGHGWNYNADAVNIFYRASDIWWRQNGWSLNEYLLSASTCTPTCDNSLGMTAGQNCISSVFPTWQSTTSGRTDTGSWDLATYISGRPQGCGANGVSNLIGRYSAVQLDSFNGEPYAETAKGLLVAHEFGHDVALGDTYDYYTTTVPRCHGLIYGIPTQPYFCVGAADACPSPAVSVPVLNWCIGSVPPTYIQHDYLMNTDGKFDPPGEYWEEALQSFERSRSNSCKSYFFWNVPYTPGNHSGYC